MFNLINLVFTLAEVGVMASADLKFVDPKPAVFPAPTLGAVVKLDYRPARLRWNETFHCRYDTLIVPFEQDWDITETDQFGAERVVRPANPGKIFGYGYLVARQRCPEKEPQYFFQAGESLLAWTPGKDMLATHSFYAPGVDLRPDYQPKWLPQVMRTVEAAAKTNPDAREFLGFIEEALKRKKAAKQESSDVTSQPSKPAEGDAKADEPGAASSLVQDGAEEKVQTASQ